MQRRLPFWCGLVMTVAFAVMAVTALGMRRVSRDAYRPPPILPQGIDGPVLALELARTTDELALIVRHPDSQTNREVLRRQVTLDGVFIGAYLAFFLALALATLDGRDPVRWILAGVLIVGIVLAARLDIRENQGMLRVLDTRLFQVSDTMIQDTRVTSMAKWLVFYLAILAAGVLELDWRETARHGPWASTTARISGLMFLIAGVVGIRGVFAPQILPLALNVLAVAVLLATVVAGRLVLARGRDAAGPVDGDLAGPEPPSAASPSATV